MACRAAGRPADHPIHQTATPAEARTDVQPDEAYDNPGPMTLTPSGARKLAARAALAVGPSEHVKRVTVKPEVLAQHRAATPAEDRAAAVLADVAEVRAALSPRGRAGDLGLRLDRIEAYIRRGRE